MTTELDIISYALGKGDGKGRVELDGSGISCADDGEGNITITTEG